MGATAAEIEAEIEEGFPRTDVALDLTKLAVGQDLHDRGEIGIRPAHILEAVRRADAIGSFEVAEKAAITLALKDITAAGYRMLVIIFSGDGKSWVSDARRLYGTPADLTPLRAFAGFVETFGAVIKGTKDQRFLPRRTLEVSGRMTAGIASGREISVQAFIRATPMGTQASWLYAIDPERYLTYVRRHTRR
ncbi:MAG: hypothetical protein ACRDJO_10100 [Actinomycetota bacterium]